MKILKRFVDPEKNIYTRQEVQKHNKPDDAWIIIDQVVYDVSEYWKSIQAVVSSFCKMLEQTSLLCSENTITPHSLSHNVPLK
jgi:hypothetical protein